MASEHRTVAEMYANSLQASQSAWKNTGELASPAPGRVRDAVAPHDDGDGVRLDAIPTVASLYERHLRESLTRWRTNPGDGVRGPGPVAK
jgi:hypothetical protein